MDRNKRINLNLILMGIALVFVTIWSMYAGTLDVSWERIFQTLIGKGTASETKILWIFRLPRSVTAMLAGLSLSLAGVIMQGVTGNEIATPSLLGITSGSSLGVVLLIYFKKLGYSVGNIPLPIGAVFGGFAVFFVLYCLSLKSKLSPAKFILNGVAVSSCVGAITTILTYRFSPSDTNYMNIVMSGSLTGATWDKIFLVLPLLVVVLYYVSYKSKYLNILNLGEEISIGFGVDLLKERKKLLYTTVFLSSIAAYLAGGLSFIGLLASHISRKLVGGNFKKLIPATILVGMLLMVLADALARSLFAPEEIPVGNMLSMIGAPYLMYLLLKTR